jgi:hypothetical protein
MPDDFDGLSFDGVLATQNADRRLSEYAPLAGVAQWQSNSLPSSRRPNLLNAFSDTFALRAPIGPVEEFRFVGMTVGSFLTRLVEAAP